MFFFGRPRLFFFGLDVAGFDACTAVFRGLPLFFFGAEVEGSESAFGTFAFADLPLFFCGAEIDSSASASVLLLLQAYVFSSLDFFPATVVLALMIRAEVELDDFAGQVAVAAAVAVMMKPTFTRVALDLFVEVVSAKLFDPDSIPMLLQVLIWTHPTLGERWRAYVTQLVRGQRELNPLL